MSIYNFNINKADGSPLNLGQYKGHVLLLVNTASKCGFTPQFAGLEKLYQDYAAKGFSIIGFPCSQFMNQELAGAGEAESFCRLNYGVTFPIAQKIEVNGPNADPLFTYLKEHSTMKDYKKLGLKAKFLTLFSKKNAAANDIKWNFTKFLIDKDGQIVERFEPTETPKVIEEKLKTLL
ncbi:MAG: glutathione peroxidase [Spirochaetaceae bacterium]|nr:glutathione peroxidase [Spirochaetaceae bacterium]